MAALEIAASSGKQHSVTVIDELERGLEPYRLRKLIADLSNSEGQSFVTTHSPITLLEAQNATLWYLDSAGAIGELPRDKIANQQRRDPLTFLAKVAVIGEGVTEVGFLKHILSKAFETDFRDHGVRVCNGEGNDTILALLEALTVAGLLFAALADNENRSPDRWRAVKAKLGDKLLRWQSGCTEENVINAIKDDQLPELLKDIEGDIDGDRLRTLADRLAINDKDFPTIQAALGKQGITLRQIIIEAATGNADKAPTDEAHKAWRKHGARWFKSSDGGVELAIKMRQLGAWDALRPTILPLVNAILSAAGQRTVTDVKL
jgi:putative ATP-dependent endonuclease of OLD family